MSKKSRDRARQREADRHRAATARSVEGVPAYRFGKESEAGIDDKARPVHGPSDDEKDPEPNRENRPTVEELVGMSEYQVRSASDVDEGDPITAVIDEEEAVTVEMDPIAAMIGEEMLSEASFDVRPLPRAQKPGSPRDSISVEPDELGAHFLKEAVQDTRPLGNELDDGESERLSAGERRMLDQPGVAREGALVTELPDGTASSTKRPRARKSGTRSASGSRGAKNAV
jgi:hypothetical protein